MFIWLMSAFMVGCTCSPSRKETRLKLKESNVILLVNCTLRADRLESYGYEIPSSPNLKKWSEQGITFDAHISQAPWTRPSLGSIFTGHYPRNLGLDNPQDSASFELTLRDEFLTIAEIFQQEGYYTIGAIGNPNAKAQFGFSQPARLETLHRVSMSGIYSYLLHTNVKGYFDML